MKTELVWKVSKQHYHDDYAFVNFLGDEYGIVILSTVRSQPLKEIGNNINSDRHWIRQNLGFVTDRHQINVGITRSKYGLIIVGKL